MTFEYDAVLREQADSGGAYVPFPWDIRELFGKGRLRVHAELDGIPYDGSIVNMGVKNPDGTASVLWALDPLGDPSGHKLHVEIGGFGTADKEVVASLYDGSRQIELPGH